MKTQINEMILDISFLFSGQLARVNHVDLWLNERGECSEDIPPLV